MGDYNSRDLGRVEYLFVAILPGPLSSEVVESVKISSTLVVILSAKKLSLLKILMYHSYPLREVNVYTIRFSCLQLLHNTRVWKER